MDELEQLLEEAINIEDYIRAAQIRDEIKRRK
jgi:protein-arginine kinase activator protein McsA